jgi:nuclear GTP-binding protein
MGTKCCKAAPVPGETKVWQYVTLTKKIYLIDSPGVVYDVGDDEVETVLKGVVRSERLKDPTDFVKPMLERAKKEHVSRLYGVQDWSDEFDFMTKLAKSKGKLLPSGEADMPTVAKIMINDWQRGKIPFFVPPPRLENGEEDDDDEEDEEGGDREGAREGEGKEVLAIGGDADEDEEEEGDGEGEEEEEEEVEELDDVEEEDDDEEDE